MFSGAGKTVSHIFNSVFVVSSCYARKLFALQELKGSAAAGGDMSHLVADIQGYLLLLQNHRRR